jgi:hypothetical protein
MISEQQIEGAIEGGLHGLLSVGTLEDHEKTSVRRAGVVSLLLGVSTSLKNKLVSLKKLMYPCFNIL